jgi:hypothetical protein
VVAACGRRFYSVDFIVEHGPNTDRENGAAKSHHKKSQPDFGWVFVYVCAHCLYYSSSLNFKL